MLIIPAIDLQNGRCVRLRQGKFDCATIYETDPVILAHQYATQGATYLHVVDLDGAKRGSMQQRELIHAMKTDTLAIQAGGGIRDITAAQACLNAGIDYLVIGSMAITQPKLTCDLITEIGANHLVLAIDTHDVGGVYKPAIHGWQTETDYNLWDVVQFYQEAGITRILCTDIARDGMMNGPNCRLYEEAVNRFPTLFWQASGGIRDIDDIRVLSNLGVSAVILGRTLYEGNFDLSACLREFAVC